MREKGTKKIKKIIKVVSCLLAACLATAIIAAAIYTDSRYHIETMEEESLDKVKSSKADKLMIVAHPDDEVIWGGLHLLEGGYYIVCITNGYNKVRSEEFYSILEETGNEGIILNYPDKVFNKRDDWDNVRDNIITDVKNVIDIKEWSLIVTHNPDGEYGHAHHKMTSSTVSEQCKKAEKTENLWYFGKYYKKDKVKEAKGEDYKYTKEQILRKEQVLTLYESQSGTIKKLSHMNPYEDWVRYSDWQN